jgi:hypothetical protein
MCVVYVLGLAQLLVISCPVTTSRAVHRYTPNYDSLDCAAVWAKDSLNAHRSDKRDHLYSRCALLVDC